MVGTLRPHGRRHRLTEASSRAARAPPFRPQPPSLYPCRCRLSRHGRRRLCRPPSRLPRRLPSRLPRRRLCRCRVYASRAVQLYPNGGQFGFARSSARTPHVAYVQMSWKNQENPCPKLLPFFPATRHAVAATRLARSGWIPSGTSSRSTSSAPALTLPPFSCGTHTLRPFVDDVRLVVLCSAAALATVFLSSWSF